MSRIIPFVVGGAVGVAAALLYAPRSGDQTRAMVSEKVNALWGEAKDFGSGVNVQDVYKNAQEKGAAAFQNAASKSQEFAAQAQAQAGGFMNAAAERVKAVTGGEAAPAYSGDSDDLKERIEAARQRIAAQVMENAEKTAAAAPVDVQAGAEAAAEAVVEAVDTVADAADQAVDTVAQAAQ